MIINSGFSNGGGRKSVTVTATLLATGWVEQTFSGGGSANSIQPMSAPSGADDYPFYQ